jgi:phosphoribosylformylglycinamidine synthase
MSEPKNHGALLKSMLARPNICSKNWIARQYDHEVQGGSVIKPLVGKMRDIPSDAVVTMPILGSKRGIAVSQTLNPFFSEIDTYHMTAITIDEAVRKVLAVGGDPDHLGGVDNFCWPTIQYDPEQNPDGKYKAAQLVRSNWALRDFCLSYEIPLLSGKDSMYIDGNLEGPYGERRKVSGMPTLLFTVSSVVQDIAKCVTLDAKRPGDLVYVIGVTKDELGGSEYYQMMNTTGLNIPKVDVEETWPLYLALHRAIQQGLVASAHAVSRGGLATHLALVAMGGETGMEIMLEKLPLDNSLPNSRIMYSESAGRFLVTIAPPNKDAFEKLFDGMKVGNIGVVTDSPSLRVRGKDGSWIIEEDIAHLKECWKRPFGGLI